jgi:hypothetical protein
LDNVPNLLAANYYYITFSTYDDNQNAYTRALAENKGPSFCKAAYSGYDVTSGMVKQIMRLI